MTGGTRRRLAPEERRQEILAAAVNLISSAGYNAVSLDTFASAAGISKAGLLHHFGSKAELLVAVLEDRDLDTAARLADSGAAITDRVSARAALNRVVEESLGHRRLVQLYSVLAAEALDPEHPAHEFFRSRFDLARVYLVEHLLFWHTDPPRAALELMSFLDGLQLSWLRDAEVDFLGAWRSFADHLFAAPKG